MPEWFWAKLSPSDDQPLPPAKGEMSRAPSQPTLSPQFCFNERALRDFLRISRSTIDDSITQNLNALLTPAQKGFDPSMTTTRQTDLGNKGQIEPEKCRSFQNDVLFPSWQNRSDVLNYCAGVATSPDPHDPDLLLRLGESAKDRERVVDERLDPYSARFFPRESRTESLAMLLRNERGVERIIRSRTWGLVTERCGGGSVTWEDALDLWREEQDRKQ
ncbi:hypothetical protein RJZ56_006823 [Blastomyces dermatitidis]|uniref:Caffeine-induced death protein Cid2 n=1 Tax=Ajellomyces dermatitidis (strain ER-3 / ATCC MYA-2586) TaxID=559297 RepID=A0ABP2F1C0_AJEDR|nr:caffeine-induced death protein Cid2 [Blastomyces dermatitidis ER-3]EEQ90469.2 caffeine-induced death protein Cid2 [Blastomyces dermatitidis ER-3]EQL32062.1 hypothetical protein BDFG_05653 [Blastomyces dermatitidis ATCC 26199]